MAKISRALRAIFITCRYNNCTPLIAVINFDLVLVVTFLASYVGIASTLIWLEGAHYPPAPTLYGHVTSSSSEMIYPPWLAIGRCTVV